MEASVFSQKIEDNWDCLTLNNLDQVHYSRFTRKLESGPLGLISKLFNLIIWPLKQMGIVERGLKVRAVYEALVCSADTPYGPVPLPRTHAIVRQLWAKLVKSENRELLRQLVEWNNFNQISPPLTIPADLR